MKVISSSVGYIIVTILSRERHYLFMFLDKFKRQIHQIVDRWGKQRVRTVRCFHAVFPRKTTATFVGSNPDNAIHVFTFTLTFFSPPLWLRELWLLYMRSKGMWTLLLFILHHLTSTFAPLITTTAARGQPRIMAYCCMLDIDSSFSSPCPFWSMFCPKQ